MCLKKPLLVIALLSLASCSLFGEESYYHKQQVAYSKAKDGPGVTVPPPLTSSKLSDAYVIPPAAKNPPSRDAPPPPGSILDKDKKVSDITASQETPTATDADTQTTTEGPLT